MARVLAVLASLTLALASTSCNTTTPAFDGARTLQAATSTTPPAGQGVVVGRLKLEVLDTSFAHTRDGLLLTRRDGTSYLVRTDDQGWFCVWLPSGEYRCESVVAYLGQPEWPVVARLPLNSFDVWDQEVAYLGTLEAFSRQEEAAIGWDLWIEVFDCRVVDEGAKAMRELARLFRAEPPPVRAALLEFEEL